MPCRSAVIYCDEFLKYDLGEFHPFKPWRCKRMIDILKEKEVFKREGLRLIEKFPVNEKLLELIHDRSYIDFVKAKSKEGKGYLDYGDTPATRGIFKGALYRACASIYCGQLVFEGEVLHAFNPGGGFHHAGSNYAAGFCVFNDVALTVRFMQEKYRIERIAVVDIDGHHGDGTQRIFYDEPILTISFHRYGGYFYPGSGWMDEIGEGEGKGYSVNVPLPAGTGDDAFIYSFDEIVPPLLKSYRPEVIVVQFGADGYYTDPLVGLALTTHTYEHVARRLHMLSHELCSGRLVMTGGGGYSAEDAARIWALAFMIIADLPSDMFNDLRDDFKTTSSNYILETVRRRVERIKSLIFPYHNI